MEAILGLFWPLVILAPFAFILYDMAKTIHKSRRRLREEEERLERQFKKAMEEDFFRERKRKQVENEVMGVLKLVREDWNRSKVKSKLERAPDKIVYRLDGGQLFEYAFSGQLKYTSTVRTTYKVGLTYQYIIVKFIETLVNDINAGLASGDAPKSRRYHLLMENIKLRRESLAKMRPGDTERDALENELKVAERMAENIKNQNQ